MSKITLKEPEIKRNSVKMTTSYYLSQSTPAKNVTLNKVTKAESLPNVNKTASSDDVFMIQKELSDLIKEGFSVEWEPEWRQNSVLNKLSNLVDGAKNKNLTDSSFNLVADGVDTTSTHMLPFNKKKAIVDLLKGKIPPKNFFRLICHSWSSKY
jgi:hypothetical protein